MENQCLRQETHASALALWMVETKEEIILSGLTACPGPGYCKWRNGSVALLGCYTWRTMPPAFAKPFQMYQSIRLSLIIVHDLSSFAYMSPSASQVSVSSDGCSKAGTFTYSIFVSLFGFLLSNHPIDTGG
ncbi:uncharacterized protein LOC9631612 [Selaginella moellendorffii]|uniref:uncharacterized protein LOC9631612 n=1 Tax=Selaginella moellendorffii TaxID=88036 RepID=UPI000D1CB70C|nr:uncharacterized protein LOC9631612 [Selaginella moellendorffii]|eukprot:XP_024529169.1 uncharacterized protein LOC9631612 [Selaginella moellendorffii]